MSDSEQLAALTENDAEKDRRYVECMERHNALIVFDLVIREAGDE